MNFFLYIYILQVSWVDVDFTNTDYVKVPIFPDFVDNFPDFSPISLPYFPRFYIN